ncbi:MAG: ATP-utilizing protein [Pirellulaceae bacterium]|nr:MAG: ATP-utilizing protein [Pirellulaceae bacterium]
MMHNTHLSLEQYEERLLAWFSPWQSCAVALSGGVDSAVVACAAYRTLGSRAVALTAVSPSVAADEIQAAQHVAHTIGIRHLLVNTSEIANPLYQRNEPDRCFHCKTELYQRMLQHLANEPVDVLVNGTNADDLGDYRPGIKAAENFQVRSPLAECGLGKNLVRQLAERWHLPVWNKPASPCLASRIAYGVPVTEERLAMIEQAERFLKALHFSNVRVRLHPGHLARIEVPAEELGRMMEGQRFRDVVRRLKELGFTYVTLDLEGLRSGSLNQLLPIVEPGWPTRQ